MILCRLLICLLRTYDYIPWCARVMAMLHRYTYRRKLDGELAQIQRLKELQLRAVALVGTVTLCRDCDAPVVPLLLLLLLSGLD